MIHNFVSRLGDISDFYFIDILDITY
ncbi:protein of unknown function [Agrobacterium pusense]|uniref:Uncharacterized protein n=1 Tax=Agrobacterium pusense TaxID=648995 RepID=U4Q7G7_9HYPH|nr:protein of unknown function [Agrobacterium pusense]